MVIPRSVVSITGKSPKASQGASFLCLCPIAPGTMADEFETQEDERASELSSISAIYPEIIIDSSDPYSASIDIRVEPIKPLAISFPPLADPRAASGVSTPPTSEGSGDAALAKRDLPAAPNGPAGLPQDVHRLSHLPPLTLKIGLPDGYPMQQPPVFDLQMASPWLPEKIMVKLKNTGHSIWEEMGRDQVVFSYIDFLREAAEEAFDLPEAWEETVIVPQNLKIALLDFDRQAKRAEFERKTFECGVCLGMLKNCSCKTLLIVLLDSKRGVVCHQLLLCSHVFCVECLQDFFNTCITEGDVTNVKCMAPNCGNETIPVGETENEKRRRRRRRKNDKTLDPSELLQIPISQEQVQRYINLKRKNRLESDRNTVYCPRQWCQGPARSKKNSQESESDSEAEEPQNYDPNANDDKLPPRNERLAICEDCSFAFCKVCKASWHGEYFSCFPRKRDELTKEELASEAYVKSFTSQCPTCEARTQKTMGCNHMVCFKCNSHFCYLCSAWLDKDNPYTHFNTKELPCYQRLWELEEGDGMGVQREVPIFEDESDEDDPAPAPAPPPAPPPPHAPLPFRRNREPVPIVQPPIVFPPRLNRAGRIQAGLERAAPLPRGGRGPPVQGLQNFLQLAQDDEEDEWDSDEMGDDNLFWQGAHP